MALDFWQFLLARQLELAQQTLEHIGLTAASLAIAVLVGVSVVFNTIHYS